MEFLKKHGEKILLLVLVTGLAVSVIMAIGKTAGLGRTDPGGGTVPAADFSLSVASLDAMVERLTDRPPVVSTDLGTFTPEVRVICMNGDCKALIPPDAEACPYCGEVQEQKPRDTDGDGISDTQEAKWNMDPNDPNDVYLDPDGDGFPTLYEFQNGTDPTVASDFPELIQFLRLADVEESSIEFEMRGTAKFGDTHTLQMAWRYPGEERWNQGYVKTGRKFGRNNEFLAESFTEKRELVEGRYLDKSAAVIRSGRYQLRLGLYGDDRRGRMTESTATLKLIFGPEWEESVRVDQSIELGQKSYKVVDISQNAVVLQADDPAAPTPITVKRPSPEDEEALEKFKADDPSPGEDFPPLDGLMIEEFLK